MSIHMLPVELIAHVFDFARELSVLGVCKRWRIAAQSSAWCMRAITLCPLANVPGYMLWCASELIKRRQQRLQQDCYLFSATERKHNVRIEKFCISGNIVVHVGSRGYVTVAVSDVPRLVVHIKQLHTRVTDVCYLAFDSNDFTCTQCHKVLALDAAIADVVTTLRKQYA